MQEISYGRRRGQFEDAYKKEGIVLIDNVERLKKDLGE
ncbi:hypothetical protein OCC_13835 [Thermococcus litoralis DSM 5473]|uniref:Uncharacterized protein n=1 Tax=Thermococcus litoralis (strain ATCC 51850 / DSM 5473 / JCM 8560 / NS-C) TaxID=523849 RepID=S5ZIB0_THELN|nr:hypothetical protein OCC_13835 [Thermococcus litoralis DSM 5473]